jgi:cyclophilin family peptidyl-prolyl cis-trans isomerase
MVTCFKRFCAYFPGQLRASRAAGQSHLACTAMKLILLLFFSCVGLVFTLTEARGDSFVEFDYNIFTGSRIRSSLFVQLYDDRPLTTANFLQYVNGGYYNSTLMHRFALDGNNVPFVLQGGGYYPQYIPEPATPLRKSLDPSLVVPTGPTVNGEYNNVPLHRNVKGSLAMALTGNPPNTNSATSQYFLNLEDNTESLDGAFTVFGQVAGDGMSLIDGYEASNNLYIVNMNPDTNDDGTPDGGPFAQTPIIISGSTFVPLILSRARVVDYFGTGITTDVPPSGLTFANKDAFIDTGAAFTNTGALTIGVGRTLGVRENYVIDRPLLNHGTLAPGLTLGVIGIAANYTQYSDGTLSLQLAGTTADTLYDKLASSGNANLFGKLQISLINGFTPALGNSFTVLTATTIVGYFETYDLPQLASGQAWKIGQSATAITLTVVEGDYNRNGVIDAGDYVVWRKTRNTSVTAWSGADGNGDGLVNDADLVIWRNNLGAIGGGIHGAGAGAGGLATSTVPEPTGGFLLFAASLLVGGHRRRARR